MGLYNRFCKRFFAAVIVRLTAQADSRALDKYGATRSFCWSVPMTDRPLKVGSWRYSVG